MFEEAAKVGGLDVQLAYYRGFNECRASRWVSDARALARPDDDDRLPRRAAPRSGGFWRMRARRPARRRSMCWSSSAMRWRRRSTTLAAAAGELGLLGLRVFIFQEGRDAGGRARLPRDRAPVRRRLCALRRQRRRATGGAAAGGGGLRRRRPEGARQGRGRRPAPPRTAAVGDDGLFRRRAHRCSPS